MTDPLSISSSIVAILQLAGTVVAYLNDVRGASEDRQQLLVEVSSVSGFLYLLKDLTERTQWNDTSLGTMSSLSVRNGPLDQFKAALQELATKLVPMACDHPISSRALVKLYFLTSSAANSAKSYSFS